MLLIKVDHLKAALVCAGKGHVRSSLNGVCIQTYKGDKHYYILGTAGHSMLVGRERLTEREYLDDRNTAFHGNAGKPVCDTSIIIPREAIEAELKLCNRYTVAAALYIDKEGAFILGETPFKPVEARFPDWQYAVPKSLSGEVAIIQPTLLAAASKALHLWDGDKPAGGVVPSISYNGQAAAVMFREHNPNAYALIMPVKGFISDFMPFIPVEAA